MRLQWLITTLVGSVLLLLLEVLAVRYDLFWHWRWIDIPLHLLGGIVIGMFAAVLFSAARLWYLPALVFVLIAWEVFELFANIPQPDSNYPLDTIADLVNGGLGAALAYFYAQKTVWHSN